MPPDPPAWTFEHSTSCRVSAEFAWAFWTNVSNWALDADVESIEIDGPFVAGSHGITNSRSSGRIEWRLSEVQPGRAIIEFPLPDAVGRFSWTFVQAGSGVTITQRCALAGVQAGTFAKAIGPSLEGGIPAGMRKLCEAMKHAAGVG